MRKGIGRFLDWRDSNKYAKKFSPYLLDETVLSDCHKLILSILELSLKEYLQKL